jgi:HD superfamily phosphohydrolase
MSGVEFSPQEVGAIDIIDDPVYGVQRIEQPLLVQLLRSSALTRLQGIHQGGSAFLVRANRDTSRYSHSVGVMLLIRLLGGSIQEQVAGLLHDISHTAFSHVVDYVFERREEDFHEQHFQRRLLRSDVPAILHRYAVSLDDILPLERWSILEQHLPDLCADRVDYTLRDLLRANLIQRSEVVQFLAALRIHRGQMVCQDLEAAVWFIQSYSRMLEELFMHPLELYAGAQLAKILKIALENGILQIEDLFLQDHDILTRLQASQQPEIIRYLALLRPGLQVIEDEGHFDVQMCMKPRIIDPLVLTEHGQIARCSQLDPQVKPLLEQMRRRSAKTIYLRALNANP